MNCIDWQKKINSMDYWDCEVLDFSINYFGDEIKLVIVDSGHQKKQEDEKEMCIIIKFLLCYRVQYETDAKEDSWRKGMQLKSMNRCQLGHYVQEITVNESKEKGLLEVSFNTGILFVTVICKDISIERKELAYTDFFWNKNTKSV